MASPTDNINLEILIRTQQAEKELKKLAKSGSDLTKALSDSSPKVLNVISKHIKKGNINKGFLDILNITSKLKNEMISLAKVTTAVGTDAMANDFEKLTNINKKVSQTMANVTKEFDRLGEAKSPEEMAAHIEAINVGYEKIASNQGKFNKISERIKSVGAPELDLDVGILDTEQKIAKIIGSTDKELRKINEREEFSLSLGEDALKQHKKTLKAIQKEMEADKDAYEQRKKQLQDEMKGQRNKKKFREKLRKEQSSYLGKLKGHKGAARGVKQKSDLIGKGAGEPMGPAGFVVKPAYRGLGKMGKVLRANSKLLKMNAGQATLLSKALGGAATAAGRMQVALLAMTGPIGMVIAALAAVALGAYLLDRKLKGMNKEIVDSAGFMALGTDGAGDLKKTLEALRGETALGFGTMWDQLTEASFRNTNKELRQLLGSLQQGGLLVKEMSDVSTKALGGKTGIQHAFETANTYSKIFGMGLNDTGKMVGQFTDDLNMGLATVRDSFAQISSDAKKTHMRADKFLGVVQSSSAQMSLYGGRVKEVSALLGKLGENALLSSKDAIAGVQELTSYFQGMDPQKQMEIVGLSDKSKLVENLNRDMERYRKDAAKASGEEAAILEHNAKMIEDALARSKTDPLDLARAFSFGSLETQLETMTSVLERSGVDVKRMNQQDLMIGMKLTGQNKDFMERLQRVALVEEEAAKLSKLGVFKTEDAAKKFAKDRADAMSVATQTIALDKSMSSIVESGFNWVGSLMEDLIFFVKKGINKLSFGRAFKGIEKEEKAREDKRVKAIDEMYGKGVEDMASIKEGLIKSQLKTPAQISEAKKTAEGRAELEKNEAAKKKLLVAKAMKTDELNTISQMKKEGESPASIKRAVDSIRENKSYYENLVDKNPEAGIGVGEKYSDASNVGNVIGDASKSGVSQKVADYQMMEFAKKQGPAAVAEVTKYLQNRKSTNLSPIPSSGAAGATGGADVKIIIEGDMAPLVKVVKTVVNGERKKAAKSSQSTVQ